MVSMTGYGEAARRGPSAAVKVEVRAVNHRFRDVVFRLPPSLRGLEEELRALVPETIRRGRVEFHVTLEEFGVEGRTVKLNRGLVVGLAQAVEEAAALLGCQVRPEEKLGLLLRFPEVLAIEEGPAGDELAGLVKEAAQEAFARLVEARVREGRRLETDIRQRLRKIEEIVQRIEERSPRVPEAYRRRLAERLGSLGLPGDIDEDRLLLEVALLAERSDITEEVVRLKSHLEQFERTAAQETAVGKKLEFLLQEMHRELTTVGVKASDVEITRLVVEGKSEVEKVREQVQNVE